MKRYENERAGIRHIQNCMCLIPEEGIAISLFLSSIRPQHQAQARKLIQKEGMAMVYTFFHDCQEVFFVVNMKRRSVK